MFQSKVQVQSVQDQGNTRVVTCQLGSQTLKMKVPREIDIPVSGDLVTVSLPREKSLVYRDGNLVQA